MLKLLVFIMYVFCLIIFSLGLELYSIFLILLRFDIGLLLFVSYFFFFFKLIVFEVRLYIVWYRLIDFLVKVFSLFIVIVVLLFLFLLLGLLILIVFIVLVFDSFFKSCTVCVIVFFVGRRLISSGLLILFGFWISWMFCFEMKAILGSFKDVFLLRVRILRFFKIFLLC